MIQMLAISTIGWALYSVPHSCLYVCCRETGRSLSCALSASLRFTQDHLPRCQSYWLSSTFFKFTPLQARIDAKMKTAKPRYFRFWMPHSPHRLLNVHRVL
ncbi:hypothetical protein BDQ17DRAFT_243971 [Cyathus striatus]|nr:hypothetical protein BDQ17DRAFT_243971 [Cyathus striatus]